MAATQRMIAERTGLSTATVAHILGGRFAVRYHAATRERVLRVARELRYRPNSSARAIRQARFDSVALVATSLEQFHPLFADALEDTLAETGRHAVLMRIPPAPSGVAPARPLPVLTEHMVDGIIAAYQLPPVVVAQLEGHIVPVVWMNVKREWDCVRCDEAAGTRRATEHLLRLGHRRIAYVDYTGGEHYSVTERCEGYMAAMRAAALAPCVIAEGYLARAERVERTRQWLQSASRPTAVLTYTETSALPIFVAALSLGLAVPRDLSLVTVYERPCDILGVTLATLIQPHAELGTAAARMLLDKISHPERRYRARTFPPRFEPGATCAPPGG